MWRCACEWRQKRSNPLKEWTIYLLSLSFSILKISKHAIPLPRTLLEIEWNSRHGGGGEGRRTRTDGSHGTDFGSGSPSPIPSFRFPVFGAGNPIKPADGEIIPRAPLWFILPVPESSSPGFKKKRRGDRKGGRVGVLLGHVWSRRSRSGKWFCFIITYNAMQFLFSFTNVWQRK